MGWQDVCARREEKSRFWLILGIKEAESWDGETSISSSWPGAHVVSITSLTNGLQHITTATTSTSAESRLRRTTSAASGEGVHQWQGPHAHKITNRSTILNQTDSCARYPIQQQLIQPTFTTDCSYTFEHTPLPSFSTNSAPNCNPLTTLSKTFNTAQWNSKSIVS